MKALVRIAIGSVCAWWIAGAPAVAGELVFPANRQAYFSSEPIELAAAGIEANHVVAAELDPDREGLPTVKLTFKGPGTRTLVLPPYSLAPAKYAVKLEGKDVAQLTITPGVNSSTMLVSQTADAAKLRAGGANFILGNAFSFGQLTPDGKPARELRQRRSGGLEQFERGVAMDLSTICYMYWTGYVVHKPWGSEKSWADETMVETMRLFNLHTAQRLRRYSRSIISVGALDEPGLAWGKTPAGGMASGFPNWDEDDWYSTRGWTYTNNIGDQSDDDWMKYMTIRCDILRQNMDWAREDLKAVWPDVVFSTDLYAPHAIMDGTDPLNQTANDIPSTHVFLDWGLGRLGVIGALYLEKAHSPTAKIAHAMNGQLFGKPVPQPQQRYAYHVTMNGMLAAGLKSNWWLNFGGMSEEDLKAVNEPAQRLGPVFAEMAPSKHDTAILWSFTEIAQREKAIAAKEAKKKTGEQIKLLIASLPENTAIGPDGKELEINAYSIGGNYKEQVLNAHQALSRAGVPAHIVHERILSNGILKNYKTLVIVGQTFEMPGEVRQLLRDFTAGGGKIVVDKTTTVKFDNAMVTDANFKDPAYRWTPLFVQDPKTFKTVKEASRFQTNEFMNAQSRDAAPLLKKTVVQAGSQPVLETDSVHLAAERHVGGDGELYMVLNGYEELQNIADDKEYFIYNYAPCKATYTLKGIAADRVVYRIEGLDWKKVARVDDPTKPQNASFEPGEMKLYLVAPQAPTGLKATALSEGGRLAVSATLSDLKMPWPLEVRIIGPKGDDLTTVYRATDVHGHFKEDFPIGLNAQPGEYTVQITSPVANLRAEAKVKIDAAATAPIALDTKVRVFDGKAIQKFLAAKHKVAIVAAHGSHQKLAERIRRSLEDHGVQARVVAEKDVFHRARYPRVWDPYIKVHQPKSKDAVKAPSEPKQRVTLSSPDDGTTRAMTADGKDLGEDWRKPETLATVADPGYIDLNAEQFYEVGCTLWIDAQGKLTALEAKTVDVQATEDVRTRWSRPWTRLSSFVGTDKLCAQLPEAYESEENLILLGDGTQSELVAALQASDLLTQTVDGRYPGAGHALIQYAWSPFAYGKDVVFVGAADDAGLEVGVQRLIEMLGK